MARPTLPPTGSPVVDPATGIVSTIWHRFFAGFLSGAAVSVDVPLLTTPCTITAPDDGHYLIVGGNVSSVSLVRGRATIATGLLSGFVPVSAGDSVIIAFSAAPAVTFIPR